jgi:hypothetical protein
MRLSLFSSLAILGLFASIATSSFAQGPGRAQPMYDPHTEITIKGTVDQVTQTTGRRGWPGTHLTFRTEGRTYDVHVGPSDYVSKNGFAFAAGDKLEVIGSKVSLGSGADTIIAREIKKDGKVLTLRDSQGIPNWSGGRRRAS